MTHSSWGLRTCPAIDTPVRELRDVAAGFRDILGDEWVDAEERLRRLLWRASAAVEFLPTPPHDRFRGEFQAAWNNLGTMTGQQLHQHIRALARSVVEFVAALDRLPDTGERPCLTFLGP
jgi:hypothetical protein